MNVYSEHLIAALLRNVDGAYRTGDSLDVGLGRITVTVGGVIGGQVGAKPTDPGLAWYARTAGTTAPAGTRGAVHLLPGNRTGLGLGAGRGVVETAGDRLVIVTHPEPGRYSGVYRLPTIHYGGLL